MINKNQNNNLFYDVIVIGAGHAGLSLSYLLKQNNINHLVFERGKIGEAWRNQRWDTFRMNTMNKSNILPGETYSGDKPDGFETASEFVTSLENYVNRNQLPVLEGATVTGIELNSENGFTVYVNQNSGLAEYSCGQIVIASGCQNEKKIPEFAKNISPDIIQLHTIDYHNAAQLPEGAVLVVGSAQSGCQIAEDLLESGREVYLSTSKVARIPRRYRGRDILDWLTPIGFFDLKTESVADPSILAMKVPQISGVGEMGHTLSLQSIAKKGGIILGKMNSGKSHDVFFDPNAAEHIKFGDGASLKIKQMIDDYILKNEINAPDPEMDEADLPDTDCKYASPLSSLNLKDKNIKSIIWSTGFGGDYSYIKIPVCDENGNPKHQNGVSEIEGMYFLGLPWLRTRKSSMIFGINDDAPFVAEKLSKKLNRSVPSLDGGQN